MKTDDDLQGTDTIQSGLVPPRIPDQSYGTVELTPHKDMVAGSYVTLSFRYTVGDKGFRPGGVLRVGTPCTGWEEPLPPRSRFWFDMQPPAFYKRNTAAKLFTNTKSSLKLTVDNKMIRYTPPGGAWRWWITAVVEGEPLVPGDAIEVIYGDKTWGGEGIQVQKFHEKDAYFEVLVDLEGEGQYVEIPASPFLFNVIRGVPTRTQVTIPSLLNQNEPFDIRLALTDSYQNPATPASEVQVTLVSSSLNFPEEEKIARLGPQQSTTKLTGGAYTHPGIHQVEILTALEKNNRVAGKSNPALVSDTQVTEKIYWGDLHNQSKFHGPGAWSVGTPDELYQYAREVSHLDFAAITDDAAPIGKGWLEIQQAAIDHYHPGEFVTFKAFEWCTKKYGHRNTIYAEVALEDRYPRALFEGSIEDFWDYFRDKNVIMIPHHTLVWTDWDYHDPELEPLVEIYSIWGASEKPGNPLWHHSQKPGGGVQAAFARGYRLGIIASTDTHAGTPGRSLPNSDRFDWQPYKGGLAAVYAPELTRAALFTALKNRRTYGTTGERIILDFQINGAPMGSQITLTGSTPPQISIRAVGTARIQKVAILWNNREVHSLELDDFEVDYGWRDTELFSRVATHQPDNSKGCFYYVRLTQVDGERAWSSPIWLQCSI